MHKELINKAIEVLKNKGTLLYPTDTIWGVGCDATIEEAVEKVFQLKQRPDSKSFIILVDSVAMLERYIPSFPEVCYDLIDFAEKPLTIVYDDAKGLASNVLAADGSIGVRVTKDPVCVQLIRGLRKPIVSTSANLSGSPTPTCFGDVSQEIKKGVDFIFEHRTEEIMQRPSSIIRVGKNADVQIIRK